MKKKLFLASMLISSLAFSQVGIHTSNPQGSFNVDGAKDNPATGTPNAAQQSNDLTVLNTGNVGIGTNTPVGKLHLYNPTTGSEMGNDYVIDDESPISQIQGLVMRRSNAGNNLAQNDFIGAMLFNPKIGGTFGYAGAGMAGIYRGNGTTALTALALRVNSNQEAVRIDENANVGIGTSTPTERLDVAGNARVRTITPVTGSTVVTPVYSDANGVLVKASPSVTYGETTSNSVNLASGATGTLITGVTQGIYKAVVLTSDACVYVATAEYFVHNYSFNSSFSIRGITGLLSPSTTKGPTFNETNQTTTVTTWTGKPACQDGGNSTALNYTVTMPSAGTINVTNNGNISRAYKIILTRLD